MRRPILFALCAMAIAAPLWGQPPSENRLESPAPASPEAAMRAAVQALTIEGFTVVQVSPRGTLQALYAREGLVFTAFAAAVSIERPRIVWSLYAANPMVAGGLSFPAQSPVSRTEKDKRARGAWESLQRAAQRVDSPSH